MVEPSVYMQAMLPSLMLKIPCTLYVYHDTFKCETGYGGLLAGQKSTSAFLV